MSEPMQRLSQLLVAGMAGALVLGATVPKVAIPNDPTRPPSFTSEPGEAPALLGGQGAPASANRLTTTVVAAGASFAVIDGQRVEEGDFVAGARVIKIDPASVTLKGGSGPYELRFYSLPVKMEPGSMTELAARVGPRVKADSGTKAESNIEAEQDVEAELESEVAPSVEVEPESVVKIESDVEVVPTSDGAEQTFDE